MKLTIQHPKSSALRLLGLIMLLSVFMMRCKDPDLIISTTDDVNITGYLERFPEEYSEFRNILDLTGNASFLAAYGSYTIFVPHNNAVKQFLQDKGKASVDQLDVEELKAIVRFHLIQDTVSTQSFTDGKITQATMYHQYLTTGATNVNGESFITVNKQAKVVKSNIRVGNGLMHVIDRVLEPAKLTVAQMMAANPAYSIFTEAAKATGFYDTLNIPATASTKPSRQWFTVMAESNAVLKEAGINSYEDLKARLSHTGDPKNPSDSLYLYMAYHILPRNSYIADLITSASQPTLAPLEVITTRRDGTSLLINADELNGVREKGTSVIREESDFSATNGVLHAVTDHYRIKIRKPMAVYWDVTDQPELRRMASVFRKLPGTTTVIQPGTLSEVTWPKSTISYVTSNDPHAYNDYFLLNMRPAQVPSIDFTTPLLVKGKYKVWICYRRVNANDIQAFFNGDPLPRLFGLNPNPGYPSGATPEEAEAQGFKAYTEPMDAGRYIGRMVGIIDVKTTDRHKLTFVGLTDRGGSSGNPFRLDMIHFIPLDMDQIRPRFAPDGTPVY
ncbi:fasciclin domain-containing protein [Pontibacter beigongshangensis]|uniref:fasciclin domain-containing protein n=1 Tax=Pontibacter beigongshangensis TaxID=2574733 RepID=UPI00164F1A81|nr:fasciclin domain-containing protein [Pontibacter beigongshangensis]